MYVPDIETHQAATLEQAAQLLKQLGPNARIMAGGTDLLVDLKTARIQSAPLVAIADIKDLRGITMTPQGLRIGALTRINDLNNSPHIKGKYKAIHDAGRDMAAYQIRNMATVGGNIASAVPCADLPPILITMQSEILTWSTTTERTIPLADFIKGPRRTALEPGEFLTAILIPAPPDGFAAAYERFALREGNAIAVASAACALTLDDNEKFTSIKICLGAVGPVPVQVKNIDVLAIGKKLTEIDLDAIAQQAAQAAQPIADIRGSIEYRKKLSGILTTRAINKAHKRALETMKEA